MNWEEAVKELEGGSAVARAEWNEEYLDVAFGDPVHVDEREFPHITERGSRYRIDLYTDGGSSGPMLYIPTDEDKAATDWELA